MEALFAQAISLVNFLLSQIGFKLSPGTLQAAYIIVAVFLFALAFGIARHHMISWSLKGAWFGIFFGILLTLLVEAALLVGGRTVLVEALRWENTPKVVRDTLQISFAELSKNLSPNIPTLGASDEKSKEKLIYEFENLSPEEQDEVRAAVCTP